MGIYEKIAEMCSNRGISIRKLEQDAGLKIGCIFNWKKSSPSVDNLSKVADYFGVSIDYLLERSDGYYINEDAMRIAQELKDRPDLQVLFDASRNVTADDLQFVIRMLNNMK